MNFKRMGLFHGLWLAVLILNGGCGSAPEPDAEPVRPVFAYRVGDPVQERVRSFSGTLRPAVESELSFRVAGEIVELPVKVGARMRPGDLIARLDTADYELQVRQALAQVHQGDALFKQARLQYDRTRELYESNNASKSELDHARAAFETAEAQLTSAQKSLELARLQLEYCSLHAPFEGRIAARPAEVHQSVAPGQPVAVLAAAADLEMVIAMPEILINRVHLDAPARLTLDALPGRIFDALVSEVGVEAGGKSAYPVRLRIGEVVPEMRIGMVGEAHMAFLEPGPPVLYVPPVSVAGAADGSRFVWVVDPQNRRVARRQVEIGALTSHGLQIVDGLQPGELVVTRGVHRLAEGIEVRVLETAAVATES